MKATLEKRFWSKVNRCTSDECWEWTAARHRQGYGWFRYQGRMHLSHRIAYMLTHGCDVDELVICHECDNPPCCNPNHLFAGTQQDNIADMDEKHRRPIGEMARHAKLTNKQAQQIRDMYKTGRYLHKDLSRLFGIDRSQISRIISRQAYKV